MAIWVVSMAVAFLLSSQLASASTPTPLVKQVCGDVKFCVETLSSEPGVVSATNLVSMSMALIEAGISNATRTQSYVQKLLKGSGLKSDYMYVLQQCDAAYNYYHISFNSALMEVKDKDYETADYDMSVAVADGIIGQCQKALGSKKIKDGVISKGNDFLIFFGRIATQVVDSLSEHKRV